MIAWRAALLTGFPSAEQYLESIDSDEWNELLAFNALDPIGEQRADIRHAHLMAMTAAAHGDRNAKAITYLPFPQTDEGTPAPSRNEIIADRIDEMLGIGNGKRS